MKKFIIERNIPEIGTFDQASLQTAAKKSCSVLSEMGPQIQWLESFVTENKTFCIYLAEDKSLIQQHAKQSGFPADSIKEVKTMISPATAE